MKVKRVVAKPKGAMAKEVKELQRQAAELLARVMVLESRQDNIRASVEAWVKALTERLEKVESVTAGVEVGGPGPMLTKGGEPSQ